MARIAKPTARGTKAPVAKRKLGRPLGSKNAPKALTKPAPKTAPKAAPKVTRRVAAPKPAAAAAPKVRHDELHDQVEKLERTVATMRSSLTRAGKGSLARIEELEERMAQLEEAAVVRPAPTTQKSKPTRVARGKRQSQDVDQGDTVPPAETDDTN